MKGRLSQADLSGERGIFLVSVLRNICMRMTFNYKTNMIGYNTSLSNIEGRENLTFKNNI